MEERKLVGNATLFLIFAVIILTGQVFFSEWKFYYDSLDYWNRADDFIKNNQFSFLNYDEPLRGYLFPFLLFIIKEISKIFSINEYLLFFIFYSLLISFTTAIIIPEITKKIFYVKIKYFQIVIFFVLFYFFWNGYFNFPLTDIISFFFILISLSFYLKFKPEKKSSFFYLILTGIFLFSSAQLRPIYLILILSILITFVLYFVFKKKMRYQLFITITGISLGMFIIAAPQVYINSNLYGTLNPLAETSKSKIISSANLYIYHLVGGIKIQKYETYIGTQNIDSAHVSFLDYKIQGQRLYSLLRENKSSIFKIAYFILLNTFDFIMIYARHLFNGLDIWYNTPYVKNLYTYTRFILSFINYTLIFLVCIFLFNNKALFQRKEVKIGFFLYFVPILFLIPTIIEVRFFLPFFILLYWIFSYFDVLIFVKNNLKSLISNYWYKYLIFLLICFILSQYTFSFLSQN